MALAAGVLSCVVLVSCCFLQVKALGVTIATLGALFGYFRIFKLPRLPVQGRAS